MHFFFVLAFIHCLDVTALLLSHFLLFHLRLSCIWVHMNHVDVLCHSHLSQAHGLIPEMRLNVFVICSFLFVSSLGFTLFLPLLFLLLYTLF